MTDTTALRAIAERATKGPLDIIRYGDGDSLVLHVQGTETRVCFMATPANDGDMRRIEANALLIREMWTALPALLDHIDAQARALEEARAALEPFVDWCDHAPADAADNLVMFELTMPQTQHVTITVGDLRSARTASQSLARQEGVEG